MVVDRHLRQRDHAPRRPDPAAGVAADAGPLRPRLQRLRGAPRRAPQRAVRARAATTSAPTGRSSTASAPRLRARAGKPWTRAAAAARDRSPPGLARGTSGLDDRDARGRAARPRPRAAATLAAASGWKPPDGAIDCAPRAAARRAAAPGRAAASRRADRRRAAADRPPRPAQQQLLDAQRAAPGEGQAAPPAADAPDDLRARAASPTARACACAPRVGAIDDRGAGERRRDAAASSACRTASATTAPACGWRARARSRARATTTSPTPLRSTCRRATRR